MYGMLECMLCRETVLLLNVADTVKPPNKGHIGDGPVVPCREVVVFSEEPIRNFLNIHYNIFCFIWMVFSIARWQEQP